MKSFMKILNSKLAPLSILLALLFGLLWASPVFARDFTFTWTANTEAVDGYKLYYKLGDNNPPFDGTGATEGNSPVVIVGGDVTTYVLHSLADQGTYSFALTAYRGNQESAYSDTVTISVLPAPTITTIQLR